MLELDLVFTVAFAGLALFLGYGIRRLLPVLARYNIPAPVIGGLLVAAAVAVARSQDVVLVQFDTTLRDPLMIAFFTTLGFAASVRLLRAGGRQVLFFFGLSTLFAVVQNVVGVAMAIPLGLDPLFGVLVGSVTLTGGPGTGLAFADRFEAAGIVGASGIAIASAMVGIVAGGIIGGPIGTRLIERFGLATPGARPVTLPANADEVMESQLPDPPVTPPAGEDEEGFTLLKSVVLILLAMWIGSWVSAGMEAMGIDLPAYIGAMIVAAVLRNADDLTGKLGISQRIVDDLGNVALALFIAMALMSQPLWEVAGLAGPMLAILGVQVAVVAAVAFAMFRWMGRDYEAAVMSGGFAGFMLGTTANAMANMRSLVERYGPAPRAFLIVPMVGAFFIDFVNALIITFCLNVLR